MLRAISSKLAQRLALPSKSPGLPPIVLAGDPLLLKPCRVVDHAYHASSDFERLVRDMHAVMTHGDVAMGISAPQVGQGVQIMALHFKKEWLQEGEHDEPLPLTFLVNPVWRATSSVITHEFEGCLSLPDVTAVVPRSLDIAVDALDLDLRPVKLALRGWPARILQHEMDHLQGRLFVERMLPRSLRVAANAHQPLPDDLFDRRGRTRRAP